MLPADSVAIPRARLCQALPSHVPIKIERPGPGIAVAHSVPVGATAIALAPGRLPSRVGMVAPAAREYTPLAAPPFTEMYTVPEGAAARYPESTAGDVTVQTCCQFAPAS